jgi:L-iditol 2-dehydrogenase
MPRLDLTFVWARELEVLGCYGYGREPDVPSAPHTFAVVLDCLAGRAGPSIPVMDLVTHRFPLTRWREALRSTLQRGAYGSIKTVFDSRPEAAGATV